MSKTSNRSMVAAAAAAAASKAEAMDQAIDILKSVRGTDGTGDLARLWKIRAQRVQ